MALPKQKAEILFQCQVSAKINFDHLTRYHTEHPIYITNDHQDCAVSIIVQTEKCTLNSVVHKYIHPNKYIRLGHTNNTTGQEKLKCEHE